MACIFMVQLSFAQTSSKGANNNLNKNTPSSAHLDIDLNALKDGIALKNANPGAAAAISVYDNANNLFQMGVLGSDFNFFGPGTANASYIANFDDKPLIFGTEGTERMRINNDGKIGIGVTTFETGRKVEIAEATDLIDFRGILTVKSTGAANINSDAYGIHGINDIDDFFGYGVYGEGGYAGVLGTVSPTGNNSYYGVYGQVVGGGDTGTNYGVYGVAGGNGTDYAVYAAGNLTVTGVFDNSSDRKLKRNIKTYNNALQQIMLLQPKTYQYQTDKFPSMNLAKGEQFGFIAQEIQEVLPQLVKTNVHTTADKSIKKIEYLGVNYMGLIPVLTKAMQEQQNLITEKESQIEVLQNQMTEKESQIEALENQTAEQDARLEKLEKLLLSGANTGAQNSNITTPQQQIILTAPSLQQNQPNPFNGQTTIPYFLPKNTKNAQLQISDIKGKVLKVEKINGTGHGQINLDAKVMPHGTYTYSLVVDGQLVETKRMILVK